MTVLESKLADALRNMRNSRAHWLTAAGECTGILLYDRTEREAREAIDEYDAQSKGDAP